MMPGPTSIKATNPTVAPPVTKAVSITTEPCVAVPGALLEKMGVAGPGEETALPDGATCGWEPTPRGLHLSIQFDRGISPLARAYNESRGPFGELFQPIKVGGLPAVVRALNPEGAYSCDVIVGTSDSQGITVNYGAADGTPRDFCAGAREIAERVVAGL